MGNEQSEIPEQDEQQDYSDVDLETVLEENTYYAETNATHPYFLIQLSEYEELEYKGHLVSDALVQYIQDNSPTHLIAQTHGWNTPPDKAVAVPFTEFIGGMQNDAAMPLDDDSFRPIFVAFIWPAVPIEFGKEPDALTRMELLATSEGPDSEVGAAAMAAKKAMDDENDEDEEMITQFRSLAQGARDDSDDEEEDPETLVDRLFTAARNGDFLNDLADRFGSVTANVLNPLQTLVFGRLMKRGNHTGRVMESVLGKLMRASEERIKLCLMANSLGAHVLAGILKRPQSLPYKAHTVFFVQGAITKDLFEEGGKFASVKDNVAGPIVCTYSEHDLMLKNIYAFWHGEAIGYGGVSRGLNIQMKEIQETEEEPYELQCGEWNSVDGRRFINEGNPVAGGHGDFKEDETTSLYWAAIKTEVDDDAYERRGGGGFSW